MAKDTLDSKQFSNRLHLLGEGEIGGLINGAKSIYFNNTPLENDSGVRNFDNVTYEERKGTSSQTYIPITEFPSNIENTSLTTIVKATPGIVQITDPDVDAVKVIINVPQLFRITSKGDYRGAELQLEIGVKYNDETDYTTKISGDDGKITGMTQDLYQREYLIKLRSAAFTTADIKVTRISDDTSYPLLTAFNWANYIPIKYDQKTYPNSALVGIRLDAETFTSLPKVTFKVRGMKIKIPNNATVRADGSLEYSTTTAFNGTFKTDKAVTCCPAWILYDLLTNTRSDGTAYGLGDLINAADIDVYSIYSASQYCNTLIDDGTGTGATEPRFSCNVCINSAKEAYTVINQMTSVFRAMSYWSAGAISLSQDSPKDASYLFSLANTIYPHFTYSDSSLNTRCTVAIVKYFDNELRDYNYEEVKDTANIARYGHIVKNINAFATTSRGAANRLGKWMNYMANVEKSTVTFVSSIESLLVRPGDVIEIADQMKSGHRRSGRIKSATNQAITVDDISGITYDASESPFLSVILSDGSVEIKAVQSISSNVITVSSAFSSVPKDVWTYETTVGSNKIQNSQWRVVAIEEQEDRNYAFTCVEYNSGKFNHIESNIALTTRDITNLNEVPPAPSSVTALETIYEDTGIAKVKIILTWGTTLIEENINGVSSKVIKTFDKQFIRWRYENDNWQTRTVEGTKTFEILDTVAGRYFIEIYNVNSHGLRSNLFATPNTSGFIANGKTDPPSQVTGVSLLPVDESSAILQWTRSNELDVLLGGRVLIRHSPLTSNAKWADANEIVSSASGNQTQKQVPLLTGTYLLKFKDDLGNESGLPGTNESDWDSTRVTIDLPTPSERTVVATIDEHTPNFAGNKDQCNYDSSKDALVINEVLGNVLGDGNYTFNNSVDLGQVYDLNIRKNLKSSVFENANLWDSRGGNIDTWISIDNDGSSGANKCNCLVYVRASNDNSNWGTWREFANVLLRGRYFQFKAILSAEDAAQNISVSELGAICELQSRIESISTPITAGSSIYTIDFTHHFKSTPNVIITQTPNASGTVDAVSGDYYELSEIDREGFKIRWLNGSSPVNRSFVWAASGFGKEII